MSRLKRWLLRLVVVVAVVGAYALSFGLLGKYTHVTWSIPYIAPDEEGNLVWTQDIPPGKAQFVFWFSHEKGRNRALYVIYYPLARCLEGSGQWMFFEEVPREFEGGCLLEGIVKSARPPLRM